MLCFRMLVVIFVFRFCVAKTLIDNHPSWQFIPTKTCGKGRSVLRARIIGGRRAFLGEFPWMARMGLTTKTSKGHFVQFHCGATLISKFYVLTAAHCDTRFNIVRLGQISEIKSHNCDDSGCAPPPQDIMVERYIRHNFSDMTFVNDVMLVQLRKAAKFDEFTMPACLPRGDIFGLDLVRRELITAGWGIVDNSIERGSPDLRFAVLPVLQNVECDGRFTSKTLAERQICAGHSRGPDSCTGDSGGPLLKSLGRGRHKQTYIMGIVSYGPSKCGQGPAVYTRVSFYMNWILGNIQK